MESKEYTDLIHGIVVKAGSRMTAWALIRNHCHEMGCEVPTMDKIVASVEPIIVKGTLQGCKDEVARKYGYQSGFKGFLHFHKVDPKETDGVITEIAILYSAQQGEWIDVKTALPEHEQYVIGFQSEDGGELYNILHLRFLSGQFFSTITGEYNYEGDITHWMPFRKPSLT